VPLLYILKYVVITNKVRVPLPSIGNHHTEKELRKFALEKWTLKILERSDIPRRKKGD
jgi:hypothetical protein